MTHGDFIAMGNKVLDAVIPPHDAEPSQHFWWRVRIAAVACMSFLGLSSFVVLAYGDVPALQSVAFVTVNDFSKLQTTVAQIQDTQKLMFVNQLGSDIRDLRSRQCAASDGLKAELDQELGRDLEEYQRRTGETYPLLPCQ